jgi:hypothetical protein
VKPFEDARCLNANEPIAFDNAVSVIHGAPGQGELSNCVNRWNCVRKGDELSERAIEENITEDERHPFVPLPGSRKLR